MAIVPLKVFVASSGLGHVARGIEAWAADLGRALAGRGLPVTVCKGGGSPGTSYERCLRCWQRTSARTSQLLRLLPRRAAWRFGLGSAYGVEQTTFAVSLLCHLRRDKVDILHVQDPQVALIVQRARSLGLVRTRTVLAHGTEEPVTFLDKITYLQHLAPWHMENARATGSWKPTWTAIPNFIDTSFFRPGEADPTRAELGVPEGYAVVLCVAAIKRDHKRIDYLLEEFASLLHRNPNLPVCLVIAGGRETDTDELVAKGRTTLRERVRFLVGYPRSRMPELYRLAEVFVLCSLKEMMPIALLEASASALPCIVNRHPVLEWITGPGGESIDMSAPDALADALQRICTDHHRRALLGRAAREHCVAHFSRDRVVSQILDYYNFVLTHDRHPVLAAKGVSGSRPANVGV